MGWIVGGLSEVAVKQFHFPAQMLDVLKPSDIQELQGIKVCFFFGNLFLFFFLFFSCFILFYFCAFLNQKFFFFPFIFFPIDSN